MKNLKSFPLGFIACIIIIISVSYYFIIDTNVYIRNNIVNKAELDSILDVRLGSGCDLSIDSCDVCPY